MTEEQREKLINDMEIVILKEGVGTILHSSQLSRMACAALAVAEEAISKDYRARIATLERRISECDDARDWLIERNRTLDARIAELEAAFDRAANDMRPMLRSMISRSEAAEIVKRAALKGEK
jgi:septal ring factor EnvC (AmiA/AmiB activator)